MSWVAEILRREHRVCAECRVGPTHLYDPAPAHADTESDEHAVADAASGTPLCNACLESRLTRDVSGFEGRCLVFEPALGPDALAFSPLDTEDPSLGTAEHRAAARACLEKMAARCERCGGDGRFLWVPVEADANLWAEDWLGCLNDGTLAPTDTLCGRCAVRRLMRTLDERGLFFEAITAPRGGDGILYGRQSY